MEDKNRPMIGYKSFLSVLRNEGIKCHHFVQKIPKFTEAHQQIVHHSCALAELKLPPYLTKIDHQLHKIFDSFLCCTGA